MVQIWLSVAGISVLFLLLLALCATASSQRAIAYPCPGTYTYTSDRNKFYYITPGCDTLLLADFTTGRFYNYVNDPYYFTGIEREYLTHTGVKTCPPPGCYIYILIL